MDSRKFLFVVVAALATVCANAAAEEVRPAPPTPPTPPAGPPKESPVKLPQQAEGKGPVREVAAEGFRVELDMAGQVLAVSLPNEESWRTADELRENDLVTVAGRGANLMKGKTVLARLDKGQVLSVIEVRGDWLATSVSVKGRAATGWVRKQDVRFQKEELPIRPTLAEFTSSGFVPASLLIQKAKQFDDGLYAAVDLAAQQGVGKFAGKKALLAVLSKQLASAPAGDAVAAVLAGARIGGQSFELPSGLENAVASQLEAFHADPLRSKPLAFYTWSDELRAIFRQDRMLQTPLHGEGVAAIVEALHASGPSRATYESYLTLISKLTNPLAYADLRPQLAGLDQGSAVAPPKDVYFFPPSISHETELVKRLFGNQPIPEGFNLADELIERIRAGEIDLTPRPESGWYDYQTWSQESLVLPDKTAEAAHLNFDDNYRKQLIDLFKGALALARETHIKQLEVPQPAAEAGPGGDEKPRPEIFVYPELTAEPLATLYQRRAAGYRFVRGVLEETFGAESLAQIHRLTAAGPVQVNLSDELTQVESLFRGAYVTVCLQLGLTPEPADGQAGEPDATATADGDARAAARFLAWAANLDRDPDLSQDARMMVPVFYDQQRKLTKVWAFLGWTSRQGWLSFATPPAATSYNDQGEKVAEAEGPVIHFQSGGLPLAYPVTAEIYVSRILDRVEFRRHCDLFRTREVILENLE